MKRMFTIILAAVMIISVMTACGGKDKNDTATPTPVATVNPTNNAMDSNSGNVTNNGSDDGMLDKAGDAIHDAGNAVEDAVDSVMDPNGTPAPNTARNRIK